MAGARRRRRPGRSGARSGRSMVLLCAGVFTLATSSAMIAYAAQQNPTGVVEDNGTTAEHTISDEQAARDREYWTDDRVREAVRNAKPGGPIAVEQD